jgi:glycosyltransferase involved in cell wall biosynthesis
MAKSEKTNTCFLLTHVPDPKINKRIRVFKEYGKTTVICTRRKSQDVWEPAFNDVEHYIFDIDLPTTKHILKRVIISNEYQNKAYKKLIQIFPDIIYVEGLDSLMVAVKYKKKFRDTVIIYDVADLREVYIEKAKSIVKQMITGVVKAEEKKCFKSVNWLVVTSPKFYEAYYYRLINQERVIFVPNVPDEQIFKNYKKKQAGVFTIGFIGGIRYLDQMRMLVEAAGECGVNVLFAGAGGTSADYDEISTYCEGKEYISFTGKYKYERDIADLYGKVDCVYAVYDADNPNVKIALPNKLYESIMCSLPIIVAKRTYLSELVEQWGVGISVDHKVKDDLVSGINKLKTNDELMNTIAECCNKRKKDLSLEFYNSKLRDIARR